MQQSVIRRKSLRTNFVRKILAEHALKKHSTCSVTRTRLTSFSKPCRLAFCVLRIQKISVCAAHHGCAVSTMRRMDDACFFRKYRVLQQSLCTTPPVLVALPRGQRCHPPETPVVSIRLLMCHFFYVNGSSVLIFP